MNEMNTSIITTRESTDFEQHWEDTLPLVLGFEEFAQGDEAQQKIIEAAYQAGVARGRHLGSLIRASSHIPPSTNRESAAFLRRLKVRAPAEGRPYCAFFGSYFFFSLLRCCCSLKSFCCSRAKR